MKIGIVYTAVTPQLTQNVEDELNKRLGTGHELLSYPNPEILDCVRETGGLNPQAAERLVSQYWRALRDGAQVILNACSSVGEVAEAAKPLFALLGVPVVLIDEEMAREAVGTARRIAVIATVPTTLEPSCRLLRRCAEEAGKSIGITEVLTNAFGLAAEPFAEALCASARELKGKADLIVLAQGSMA